MNKLHYNGSLGDSHVGEILHEIYVQHLYDSFIVDAAGVPRRDMTIVDLGANIGLTAQYFAQAGNVYAVEACREHFQALMLNTRGYPVWPLHAAVGGMTDARTLYHYPNLTSHGLADLSNGEGEKASTGSEPVTCYGMADLLRKLKLDRVDLMKMDIEGGEYEVALSEQFGEAAPHIDTIIGELHGWGTMGFSPTDEMVDAFTGRLRSVGYRVYLAQPMPQTMFLAKRE